MINRLADAGAAILVTTHYLEEAEQCNRLGMMVAGELVAEGTPSGIKARQSGTQFNSSSTSLSAPGPAENHRELARLAVWRAPSPHHRRPPRARHPQTTKWLEAHGLHVLSAREDRFSLEDVFISIVEKARLEGKVSIEK